MINDDHTRALGAEQIGASIRPSRRSKTLTFAGRAPPGSRCKWPLRLRPSRARPSQRPAPAKPLGLGRAIGQLILREKRRRWRRNAWPPPSWLSGGASVGLRRRELAPLFHNFLHLSPRAEHIVCVVLCCCCCCSPALGTQRSACGTMRAGLARASLPKKEGGRASAGPKAIVRRRRRSPVAFGPAPPGLLLGRPAAPDSSPRQQSSGAARLGSVWS